MKILIKTFTIIIVLNFNAVANENNFFGLPSYWENLKQVQKDFYMKGALDAWGYYIWNNAPDDKKDLLISQQRFCIKKESKNFQNYVFMLGWDKDDSAATEIYRWSSAACNNLSKTSEYQNIKIQKDKPLENVTRELWLIMSEVDKSAYIEGYVDGSLDTTRSIVNNPDAPKDAINYYKDLLGNVNQCFESKGLKNLTPFIIKRELNESYPIAWNISFSLGAFCG
jgi:hypothetical protein